METILKEVSNNHTGNREMDVGEYATDLVATVIRVHLVLVAILLYKLANKQKNLPPGPRAYPFVGNMNWLMSNPDQPYKIITDLSQRFGPIMTFKFGGETAIIISDYDTLKKVFVDNSDITSERPEIIIRWEREKGGEEATQVQQNLWKENHNVNENILHKVCIRRKPFEYRLEEDLEQLLAALGDQQGAFDPSNILTQSVTSISWHFCSGQRFNYNEPALLELVNLVFRNLNYMRTSVIHSYCHIPVWLQNLYVRMQLNPVKTRMDELAEAGMAQHQTDFNDNTATDVIGAMTQLQKRHPDDILFTDENIRRALNGFMLGGVDSMQSVLRWLFLYFIHYPHIQDRCYEDVEQFIGDSRQPGISDCANLKYITATIYEVLRHGNIAPLGVPHSSSKDLEINGYNIPRRTLIFSNQWAIHRDPAKWERADDFIPERWLDENGHILHHGSFIPFSIGPRHCPGEKFAKLELVALTAGILQRFKILPSEHHPTPDLEGVQHLSLAPKPFHIVLEPRV